MKVSRSIVLSRGCETTSDTRSPHKHLVTIPDLSRAMAEGTDIQDFETVLGHKDMSSG